MPATKPRPEQLQKLATQVPADGPVYLLNLLKFKARAEYADGRMTDLTGEQAYAIYVEGVSKLIASVGGRVVWNGRCNTLVIGDEDEPPWDSVAIVEYPRLEAYEKVRGSANYGDVHVHREAGLAHQLLIHCLSIGQVQAALSR